MSKLIIQSIQVDSSLNKPEINERGLSIGNKSIDGVISLNFQSSGNFDEFLNKDGYIDRFKVTYTHIRCVKRKRNKHYNKYMKLLDHLNKVSKERGFDNFQHATNEGVKYVIDSIIEEAGNRFKNEK